MTTLAFLSKTNEEIVDYLLLTLISFTTFYLNMLNCYRFYK